MDGIPQTGFNEKKIAAGGLSEAGRQKAADLIRERYEKLGWTFSRFQEDGKTNSFVYMIPPDGQPPRWYDHLGWVWLALLAVYPVGLYALYRSRALTQKGKVLCGVAGLVFIGFLGDTFGEPSYRMEALNACTKMVELEAGHLPGFDQSLFEYESKLIGQEGEYRYLVKSHFTHEDVYGDTYVTRWRCVVDYVGGDPNRTSSWDLFDLSLGIARPL